MVLVCFVNYDLFGEIFLKFVKFFFFVVVLILYSFLNSIGKLFNCWMFLS